MKVIYILSVANLPGVAREWIISKSDSKELVEEMKTDSVWKYLLKKTMHDRYLIAELDA